jgi:hypothetical protein
VVNRPRRQVRHLAAAIADGAGGLRLHDMASDLEEGATCAPNMSAGASRLRRRVAWGAGIAAVAAIAGATALGAPWWVRLVAVLVPALVATSAYFEARSNVCVLRAAQGTFEDDARARTPMQATLLPSIRRVARSIIAKGAVTGLLASILLVAVSLAF